MEILCSLRHEDVPNVSQMFATLRDLSGIEVVTRDRNTLSPLQAENVPEGSCLVIFQIPPDVFMPRFFQALSQALRT